MPQREASELARTERTLADLISGPAGVQAAREYRQQRSGESAVALAELLRGDEQRPAELRLHVYTNAYFQRLLECLRDDYKALEAAIGVDTFAETIASYLVACPSRHASIRYCGDRVAEFLSTHANAAALRERYPWASDLARLEWSLLAAFDAPDGELLRAEHVAAVPAEEWAEIALRADPAARLLELEWPVVAVRRAFENDEPLGLESLEPRRETALVWRYGEQPAYRALDLDEASAFARVVQGTSFGEVCECAAEFVGDEEAPAQAAQWLAVWLGAGCIQRAAEPASAAGS